MGNPSIVGLTSVDEASASSWSSCKFAPTTFRLEVSFTQVCTDITRIIVVNDVEVVLILVVL
eukprot:7212740-Prorocentrum_lima.AAC.1